MKLLLDTHIWIWSVASPERLSRKVVTSLESSKNDLWLSPISVWELLLLVEKRSVELDRPRKSGSRPPLRPLRSATQRSRGTWQSRVGA